MCSIEPKTVRVYTNIWSINGTLYSIGDMKLPFALPYIQIAWFMVLFFLMLILGDWLSFLPMSSLFRYVVIPGGLSFLFKGIDFGGKNPVYYFKTIITYALRPKKTYLGNKVAEKQVHSIHGEITAVERRTVSAAD